MDIATLFTQSKWDILTHLSKGKFSPLQLSKVLNTSIANVSQQLRLLELAGLLKKEKVSAREAGKPRTLYSLANDFGHVTLMIKNCAERRLIPLMEHHKVMLRIWMIPDVSAHYFLEKFYWKIEPWVEQTKAILVDAKTNELTVYLVTESKDLDKKVSDTAVKSLSGETRNILVKVILDKELGGSKLSKEKLSELYAIHDPTGIIIQQMR